MVHEGELLSYFTYLLAYQVDSVWSTKASDPTKDFLKLSLAERTQTLTLAKPGQVCTPPSRSLTRLDET